MKKKLLTIAMIIVYITGFLLLSYPEMNHVKNYMETKQDGEHFQKAISETDVKSEKMEKLYEKMAAYNEELYKDGQKHLSDPFVFEETSVDLSEYGVENEVVAMISIPAMDVELPVYLGASKENMAKGAVHLSRTSLPIGGNNSNTVIAAHRGYNGIPMFQYIENIKLNDKVYITNLWEKLTYQVTDIQVIEPDEVDRILIQEGKDMLTIFTCHPYTMNTYRYAVFCERVANSKETKDATTQGSTQMVVRESAENIREMAMEQDSDIIKKEKTIRVVGYVLYLVIGLEMLRYFWRHRKNAPVNEEEAEEQVDEVDDKSADS